jgi:hypothetical protein
MTINTRWLRSDGHYTRSEIEKIRNQVDQMTENDLNKLA